MEIPASAVQVGVGYSRCTRILKKYATHPIKPSRSIQRVVAPMVNCPERELHHVAPSPFGSRPTDASWARAKIITFNSRALRDGIYGMAVVSSLWQPGKMGN